MEGKDVITLAAAPQIVQPVKTGLESFVNNLFANTALAGVCVFLGGVVIAVCIILLVMRKWWPNTGIGQMMYNGQHSVMWCSAGIALGVILIAPKQIVPAFGQIIALFGQIILDVIFKVAGL